MIYISLSHDVINDLNVLVIKTNDFVYNLPMLKPNPNKYLPTTFGVMYIEGIKKLKEYCDQIIEEHSKCQSQGTMVDPKKNEMPKMNGLNT
jgi:hypothetical protein